MSNNQGVSSWEDDINDDNKESEYDNESTKEIARRNNVKQPKALINDSEDSITTNSRAKTVTGTNAKEISWDESANEPAWYIARGRHQESSNNESIPKKSFQISHKYRRERYKKQQAAMASRKCTTADQHQNNTNHNDEWITSQDNSKREISGSDENYVWRSNQTTE